jgi:hypothetical protein
VKKLHINEKGDSTGKFFCARFFAFGFDYWLPNFWLVFFCVEEFFLDPSSQRETTVDVGKMKKMAQEPATAAEALENPEAYKCCLEYHQAQGVNFDTFKFIGIGLDKLRIMLKKPELKFSRCINDAFIVPDGRLNLLVNLSLSWQTPVLP